MKTEVNLCNYCAIAVFNKLLVKSKIIFILNNLTKEKAICIHQKLPGGCRRFRRGCIYFQLH